MNLFYGRVLKVAISTGLMVLIFLICLRLFGGIPKPLFLFLSTAFLILSAIFWTSKKGIQKAGVKEISQVILIWISVTGVILSATYRIDRAGWNWFKLTGYDTTLSENYPELENLSADEFIQKFPIFSVASEDSSEIWLAPGDYEIYATIVVPENLTLRIVPGTRLKFDVGCSLISFGSVFVMGTEAEPIVFTAKNKWLKWGVVGIVGAPNATFEYVYFEHARQAVVNDVYFVAGLSLYDTDATITHCRFIDMYGKDAVNVRNGHIVIRNNYFANIYKDGLDLDRGSGEISYNDFINCLDEGIDLSENFDVHVFKNRILDAKGGRISADNNLSEIRALNTFGYSNR